MRRPGGPRGPQRLDVSVGHGHVPERGRAPPLLWCLVPGLRASFADPSASTCQPARVPSGAEPWVAGRAVVHCSVRATEQGAAGRHDPRPSAACRGRRRSWPPCAQRSGRGRRRTSRARREVAAGLAFLAGRRPRGAGRPAEHKATASTPERDGSTPTTASSPSTAVTASTRPPPRSWPPRRRLDGAIPASTAPGSARGSRLDAGHVEPGDVEPPGGAITRAPPRATPTAPTELDGDGSKVSTRPRLDGLDGHAEALGAIW